MIFLLELKYLLTIHYLDVVLISFNNASEFLISFTKKQSIKVFSFLRKPSFIHIDANWY